MQVSSAVTLRRRASHYASARSPRGRNRRTAAARPWLPPERSMGSAERFLIATHPARQRYFDERAATWPGRSMRGRGLGLTSPTTSWKSAPTWPPPWRLKDGIEPENPSGLYEVRRSRCANHSYPAYSRPTITVIWRPRAMSSPPGCLTTSARLSTAAPLGAESREVVGV